MKKIYKILFLILAIALIVFLLTRQIDIDRVLQTGGLIALGAILLAETGFLVGFFLPGDTLLFAAGFFAAQGRTSLWQALVILFIGTFIGNIIGYEIGKRTGHRIFKNEEALLFSKNNVTLAENFYKKHGGKTILIARFVPIVRTIAPPLAGMGKMNYRLFIFYNFVGSIVWVISITLIGFWAGKVVGHYFNIDKYILPVVILATVLTFGGSVWHILKDPKSRTLAANKIKTFLKDVF